MHLGAGDVFHVEDELEEALQSGLWGLHYVLVANDVHRNFGV